MSLGALLDPCIGHTLTLSAYHPVPLHPQLVVRLLDIVLSGDSG